MKMWSLVVVAALGCGKGKAKTEAKTDPKVVDKAPGSGEAPPVAATGSRKVVKIGAGDGAACAVMDNGTVRCWGRNDNGERGGEPSSDDAATAIEVAGVTDAVDIVMGGDSGSSGDIACAIKKDKSAQCWGGKQMVPKEPLKDVASIALGGGTGYVAKADGSVWGWGSSAFNSLADGTQGGGPDKPLTQIPGITSAKQVAAGQNHACALLGDGTVTCWGYVSKKQAPTAIAGIAGATAIYGMSQRDITCATLKDGVQCWGDNVTAKPMPELAVTAKKIAGRNHMCALDDTGAAWCWGDNNDFGQLGPTGGAYKPSKITGVTGAVDIAVGHVFTCVAQADGNASCWGYNQRGQLGDGTLMDRAAPTLVAGITADKLAVAKTGQDAVQEGETPTSWDGLPAQCKTGPIEITSKSYEGKAFTVKAAKADSQLGGKTITIDLADHNFHKSWGGPRGKQGRLGLRLAKFEIKGDKREPVTVDAGEYKLGLKEERLVAPSFVVKTGSTSLISIGMGGVDAGKVTITHLDDKWVCGDLALASDGSSVKGPFAAPLEK